ncbi:MAG: 30S ribosomal protein S13 [Candidatus Aenigmarchaeota archaeon]|nr:30S ribosomal protein S13 [Candidatus Aenigmarchaeota archaeon]
MDKPKQDNKENIRRIVRIMSTDIDGNLPVRRALRKIKGISFMFSNAVYTTTGIDKDKKVGTMTEQEIKQLEGFITNPKTYPWLLNRRKDVETGTDMHITMANLDLKKREDINMLKKIRAYKGVRHELGQPARGQRTRSSFRTSKTVGVSKKRIMAAAKPAATAPAKEKK